MPINAGTATPTFRLGTATVSRMYLGTASVYAPDTGTDSSGLAIPYQVAGVAGDAAVVLQWRSAVGPTGYRVQYSSNGGGTWATSTASITTSTSSTVVTGTSTISGLTNGTSYVFRVAGTKSSAVGEYSAASVALTPESAASIGPPTAVTAGIVSGDFDWVRVYWTAPVTTRQIVYALQQSEDGGTTWTLASTGITSTVVWVRDVTPGTAYKFRVASVIASTYQSHLSSGTPAVMSAWSDPTSSVTAPISRPRLPQELTAEPTSAGAYVAFTAPLWNGNSAITGYKVYVYAVGAARPATATQTLSNTTFDATVTGLTNGTEYVVDVTAVNAVGESDAATVRVTPLANIPPRLSSFAVAAGAVGSLLSQEYYGFVPAEVEIQFSTTQANAVGSAGQIIEVQYATFNSQTNASPRFWPTTSWLTVASVGLTIDGAVAAQTLETPPELLVAGTKYAFRARAVKGLLAGPHTYATVTTAQ